MKVIPTSCWIFFSSICICFRIFASRAPRGFEDNEEIEVVLRPEDLDIVEPSQAKINGVVRNVTFKGVHYEILVETELRTYKVQTTDYAEVGRQVGLKFGPEDIHVMYRMGAY